MKRPGISGISLSMAILALSIVLIITVSGPLKNWFSKSVERAYLAGGQTSIEVVAASGIGTDEPLVYVRNLGPNSISLGYDTKRDPSLWQVFIGNENFEAIEVGEIGREEGFRGSEQSWGNEIRYSKVKEKGEEEGDFWVSPILLSHRPWQEPCFPAKPHDTLGRSM